MPPRAQLSADAAAAGGQFQLPLFQIRLCLLLQRQDVGSSFGMLVDSKMSCLKS